MNRREYQKFLKSKEWKDFRNANISEECFICDKNYYLELHHTDYSNLLDKNTVVTLCKYCHKKIHFTRKNRRISLKTKTTWRRFCKRVSYAKKVKRVNNTKDLPELKMILKKYCKIKPIHLPSFNSTTTNI